MSNHPKETGSADPFKPYGGRFESYRRLPKTGRDREDIFQELSAMAGEENARWRGGNVSGTFYHAGADHLAFLSRVFSLFAHVNVLQSDLCPSMSKFESEIVAMTAGMLHGDAVKEVNPEDEVCGTVTFGGSESIMMAMKVYRDRARAEKGITAPEIITPQTAHPAFDKAGEYFGIKMNHVPVAAPDHRVNPAAVEALINPNTVALVGSAGNYPYGLVDPIEGLSAIALRHGLGLHVDGCLGGFILPWVEKLGYKVPLFDFRLPGLTSISADTHKYGFGLKGNSVVLYRNRKLRRYQYFSVPDWPGGIYASPSMTGSRSGGLSASTWAAMVYLGEEGYLRIARAIMDIADRIREGVRSIPELKLIGESTFLVSFRSDEVDIFHVNDYMAGRGWRFNCLQLPPAIHFCVTVPQTLVPGVADRLVADLRQAVPYARSAAGKPAMSSAIYGLAGTAVGNAAVKELLYGFFDHLFEV
jgi:sphinganine-1-phosphate aldolase